MFRFFATAIVALAVVGQAAAQNINLNLNGGAIVRSRLVTPFTPTVVLQQPVFAQQFAPQLTFSQPSFTQQSFALNTGCGLQANAFTSNQFTVPSFQQFAFQQVSFSPPAVQVNVINRGLFGGGLLGRIVERGVVRHALDRVFNNVLFGGLFNRTVIRIGR